MRIISGYDFDIMLTSKFDQNLVDIFLAVLREDLLIMLVIDVNLL